MITYHCDRCGEKLLEDANLVKGSAGVWVSADSMTLEVGLEIDLPVNQGDVYMVKSFHICSKCIIDLAGWLKKIPKE